MFDSRKQYETNQFSLAPKMRIVKHPVWCVQTIPDTFAFQFISFAIVQQEYTSLFTEEDRKN